MAPRRSALVVTLSAWRAGLLQRLEGRRGASALTGLLPVQLERRPPRRSSALPPQVADLARPIRCPQVRRGTLVVDRLPDIETPAFARLLWRARRRRDVVLQLDEGAMSAAAEPVACLAASGANVRLVADRPPPRALSEELIDRLRTPPCHERVDCELRSVRLRRAAHDHLWPTGSPPGISVLLASRRPDDIGFAIDQIGRQVGVDPHVVVGLHGDWPAGAESELSRLDRVSSVTRFDAATPLGGVLDSLCVRADANLITKWDDDDWYGVDHLADLVRAYDYSGAEIVGKAAEFVRLETSDLTIRRFAIGAESYSRTLAGGTLLMSKDWLHEIGGWTPVRRGVDRAVLEATRRRGGRSYRTHGFQYVLRRRAGDAHTWEATDTEFAVGRVTRRKGLDLPFADIEPVDIHDGPVGRQRNG